MNIRWVCDECGHDAEDGHILVRRSEIEALRRRVEEKHGGDHPWPLYSAQELEELVPAKWRVLHAGCDDTPWDTYYWRPVDEMSTWPKFVEFLAHMMEKDWFTRESWASGLAREAVKRSA